MITINILILASVLLNCSGIQDDHTGQNRLAKDETINQVFDKNEIQDLQLLFDFFNQNICSNHNSLDLTECYHAFLSSLYEEANNGGYDLNIPIENQKKAYAEISEKLFEEVWTVGEAWAYMASPQFGFKSVQINPFGKYALFLEQVGEEYENINIYYTDVLETGGSGPSISNNLLSNYNSYNIEDIRVKLIFAIHYLKVNHNSENFIDAYSK